MACELCIQLPVLFNSNVLLLRLWKILQLANFLQRDKYHNSSFDLSRMGPMPNITFLFVFCVFKRLLNSFNDWICMLNNDDYRIINSNGNSGHSWQSERQITDSLRSSLPFLSLHSCNLLSKWCLRMGEMHLKMGTYPSNCFH